MHLGLSVLLLLCTKKKEDKKTQLATKRCALFAMSLNDCIISFPGKPLGFIKGDEKQMRTILLCIENSFSGVAYAGAPRLHQTHCRQKVGMQISEMSVSFCNYFTQGVSAPRLNDCKPPVTLKNSALLQTCSQNCSI